jgi:hypothetical protein
MLVCRLHSLYLYEISKQMDNNSVDGHDNHTSHMYNILVQVIRRLELYHLPFAVLKQQLSKSSNAANEEKPLWKQIQESHNKVRIRLTRMLHPCSVYSSLRSFH